MSALQNGYVIVIWIKMSRLAEICLLCVTSYQFQDLLESLKPGCPELRNFLRMDLSAMA